MKITYYGQSAFLLETGPVFKALIDPFLTGNPLCPVSAESISGVTHIFVTHGHGDHLGDTVPIAKRCNSLVITNFELGDFLVMQGVRVHTMHIGGRVRLDFGRVKMTPALHGSGISTANGMREGGTPGGFLIETAGKKIYHAGDTGLTMDMKLLEEDAVDLAMLPMGGNYTMDIDDAVRAVSFIRPKLAIPMHYDTFEVIRADPEEFRAKVRDARVKILKPGESMEL